MYCPKHKITFPRSKHNGKCPKCKKWFKFVKELKIMSENEQPKEPKTAKNQAPKAKNKPNTMVKVELNITSKANGYFDQIKHSITCDLEKYKGFQKDIKDHIKETFGAKV